jgi:hypothetical protein
LLTSTFVRTNKRIRLLKTKAQMWKETVYHKCKSTTWEKITDGVPRDRFWARCCSLFTSMIYP